MTRRRTEIEHPLARHALLDRRDFIARAAAAAMAAGSTGALLSACASSTTGSTAGTGAAGTFPGTTAALPPLPFDDALGYWMQGGFGPVKDEIVATDLPVTGALPPELTGLYVRNGSNPAGEPSSHWFLGDGMVHGVRLEKGKAVWYRNKYVDTPMYRSGKGLLGGGGGAPGGAANQSNVSVFWHADKLLSSGEIGFPYELDPADLRTKGVHDYGGALKTAMTAHPKIDPATGRLHFFGYGFVPPYLTYHVVEPDGRLVSSEEVAVAGPTMMHDFAITDRDVIFWELPVVFDLQEAIKAVSPGGATTAFPFKWDESYGARIGIMPLGGPASAIRWVEIDPCYVFHGVNAHRDGDDVVVEVCRLPTMFKVGGDPGNNAIHRWRINTAGEALTFRDEVISDVQMDLPSIDRRRTGLAHANAWYLMVDASDANYPIEFSGLARRDSKTGALDTYEPGPGYRLNEGTFIAASPTEAREEGWLVAYAWDRRRDASDLVVLDATDLARGPVAKVHLPVRVPYGFHGVWRSE